MYIYICMYIYLFDKAYSTKPKKTIPQSSRELPKY